MTLVIGNNYVGETGNRSNKIRKWSNGSIH